MPFLYGLLELGRLCYGRDWFVYKDQSKSMGMIAPTLERVQQPRPPRQAPCKPALKV